MTSRGLKKQISTLLVLAFWLGTVASAAPFPALSLRDPAGHEQSLSAYSGKIIVLNFWATWCGPCREELPRLDELAREYAPKDVVFIAASIDEPDTQTNIPAFLARKNISTLPIWVGAAPDTLKEFQLSEIVPATIILDQDGQVIARIMGEASKKDITSRLDWLLNGRVGKHPKTVLKNF